MEEEKDRKPISLYKLMKLNPQRYHSIFSVDIFHPRHYRENIMPESPDIKTPTQHSPLNMTGGMGSTVRDVPRPQSGGTALPASGNHSPIGSINGGTMSPSNLLVNSSASQQLPPACGARQLSKLKRFLTTLQQFGSDISPEIGERVRTLVLGLVNSHLSIEEFHAKLQEATNFPLRPFVIPFLKANLPLLQRELLHCARMAKQTPQQYLSQHEQILFDHSSPPNEPQDYSSEFNENGKRRTPDRPKENGIDPHPDHPVKRFHSNRVSPNGILNLNVGPIRLEDVSLSRELREHERQERARLEHDSIDRKHDRDQQYPSYNNYTRSDSFDPLDRLDDDWRHVETMLNCIIGMVDKTKRALAVLQERSLRDREELSLWMRRQAEGMDQDIKKRSSDMVSHTLRQTEERVTDVRRRAEEAVNEVKRQAMLELQKAVKTAEMKANELVTTERIKMERAISDARKQAREDILLKINHQEESSESCWNCGRKASETCSGCNIARYCGSFCQHKDWENHHLVCGKSRSSTTSGLELIPDSHKSASTSPQETLEIVTKQEDTSPINSERLSVSPRSNTLSPAETKAADVSR